MVPGKGRLSRERVGRIITDLLNHRYVGTLTAKDDDSAKEFYFAGSGVKATSVGPRKSLPIGRFMICAGYVGESQVEEALARQEQSDGTAGPLGEVLMGLGYLSEEDRDKALYEQLVEEIADLFFWPQPQYTYQTGHQTRVGFVDRLRDRAGVKSLSFKTNLAQVLAQAKTQGSLLRDAGRRLGGVDTAYKATAKAKELLFTKEKFQAMHPTYRALIPLLTRPRSVGEVIELGRVPWSFVLSGMHDLHESKLIEPAEE